MDLTLDELIKEVRESHKEYIVPGRKPAGRMIFYREGNLNKPRQDVITIWRLLYVKCNTEYSFAIKAIGDWDIYQRLLRCCAPLRNKFIPEWTRERELRLLSESYTQVRAAVISGDVATAKWLINDISKAYTVTQKKDSIDSDNKASPGEPQDDILNTIESNYDTLN